MKKVLVLFGGNSNEHQISCKSAQSILSYMDHTKFSATAVGITKQNEWYQYFDTLDHLSSPNWHLGKARKITNIIDFIKQFDLVFPILHGTNGEDGKIQGMLELFHIPYVGCNSKISSIGMDKHFCKLLLECFQIPIVPFQLYEKKEKNKFSYPIIIKPCNGGSSIGISVAHSKKEFRKGIQKAKKMDSKILLEPFLEMRELECAVLEKKGNWIISSIGEIKTNHTFYDFDAKYINSSKTNLKADLPKDIEEKIKTIAQKICHCLELRGLARIDFFYVPKENQVYVNEINTLPGFTTISMYPKLLTTSSYQKLITTLLENAHY